MKVKIPYNAGDLVMVSGKKYMIAGHVWWPVERRNAYHCILMDGDELIGDPVYIWDYEDGEFRAAA